MSFPENDWPSGGKITYNGGWKVNRYDAYYSEYSLQEGIEPNFVKVMTNVLSGGDADFISPNRAKGLIPLPAAAAEEIKRISEDFERSILDPGIYLARAEASADPRLNIQTAVKTIGETYRREREKGLSIMDAYKNTVIYIADKGGWTGEAAQEKWKEFLEKYKRINNEKAETSAAETSAAMSWEGMQWSIVY
jgi:hypothetical protein